MALQKWARNARLSVVVPDYIGKMRRAEEAVLQENLALMRDSLDKHYADTGRYPIVRIWQKAW